MFELTYLKPQSWMVIHMAIKGEETQKLTHCQGRLEDTSLSRVSLTEWRQTGETVLSLLLKIGPIYVPVCCTVVCCSIPRSPFLMFTTGHPEHPQHKSVSLKDRGVPACPSGSVMWHSFFCGDVVDTQYRSNVWTHPLIQKFLLF